MRFENFGEDNPLKKSFLMKSAKGTFVSQLLSIEV
jgi:hypothetical protein